MNVAIPFAALLLSAGIMFVCNWLALKPWRLTKDKHWSEQARLSYPVFVAARSNLFTIPAVFTLILVLLWPDSSPPWFFTGTAAILGAYLGMFPAICEVHPRIRVIELLEQLLVGVLVQFPVLFLFIMVAVFMPDEPNAVTFLFGVVAAAVVAHWRRLGAWLAWKMGVVRPAPERLQAIVEATAAKMDVKFGQVLVVRSPMAQAIALISQKKLLFTERILELLSDEELAAICAHELAHLTESRWVRVSRSISYLTFWPWIFFKPVLHLFGLFGLFGLCFITFFVPKIYRLISHKMESRADQMAKSNEGDAGTYARALARLYEDNLAPAVNSMEKATHPHLYDRLLAAGVTPDFPRLIAARKMSLHGTVFAGLAGGLFAVFAIHFSHLHSSG